jgi:hypothetical protein
MATRAQIDAAIEAAAEKYGVDPQYLKALAQVESSYDPSEKAGSGAAGLFQFMPKTAKAYDLKDPYDYKAAAEAAARFTIDNQMSLTKRLGREPTPQELYMAHQQGATGAGKILSKPNANAIQTLGYQKVAQNVPRLKGESEAAFRARIQSMSVSDFSNLWGAKLEQAYSYVGAPLTAQPVTPPVPMSRDARPQAQAPVPMARTARPQPPAPLATPAGLNLPQPKPAALSGNPVFDINQTPRLNANGVVEYGNYPRAITAADMGAARQSLYQPPAPAFVSPGGVLPGATLTGQPRQMAPMTLANMPSSWYTGPLVPQTTANPNPVASGAYTLPLYSGAPLPASSGGGNLTTRTVQTVRVGENGQLIGNDGKPIGSVPPSFTYQPRTPLTGFGGMTGTYNPPSISRGVTTQTVRPNGTVSGTNAGNIAGSTALPAGVRPNIAPIVTTPKPTSFGAGLSFPSGVGVPLKPITSAAKPISSYGNIPVYGSASPPPAPTRNALTGFGGMTGTYYPPVAPTAQKKPVQSYPNLTYSPPSYSMGMSNGNYTVQRGDTLSALASKFGTTVNDLARINNISNPNNIAAGAKLITPTTTRTSSTTSTPGGSNYTNATSASTSRVYDTNTNTYVPKPAGQVTTSSNGTQTVTGTSTGTKYVVGQTYTTGNGSYIAQADGTFKRI